MYKLIVSSYTGIDRMYNIVSKKKAIEEFHKHKKQYRDVDLYHNSIHVGAYSPVGIATPVFKFNN